MKSHFSTKIIILICFLIITSFSFAEPQRQNESRNKKEAISVAQEGDYLKELKRKDPVAYELVLKEMQLSNEIDSIVISFRDGKITESQARFKLIPLVRKSLKQRINYLDEEIADTGKRLKYLKKIRNNPKFLINEEINLHLSKICSQKSTSP